MSCLTVAIFTTLAVRLWLRHEATDDELYACEPPDAAWREWMQYDQ